MACINSNPYLLHVQVRRLPFYFYYKFCSFIINTIPPMLRMVQFDDHPVYIIFYLLIVSIFNFPGAGSLVEPVGITGGSKNINYDPRRIDLLDMAVSQSLIQCDG